MLSIPIVRKLRNKHFVASQGVQSPITQSPDAHKLFLVKITPGDGSPITVAHTLWRDASTQTFTR